MRACVRACVRVCVNNKKKITHRPLLFTVNHLHYGKKGTCFNSVFGSFSKHHFFTLSKKKKKKKKIAFPYGTKHFGLHKAVLIPICVL